MRSLVWLLLLANLGMLVWLLTQPEPQPAQYRPVPVPPGIEPLVLLSERPVSAASTTDSDQALHEPVASASALQQTTPVVSEETGQASSEPAVDSPDDPGEPPQAVVPAESVCQTIGPFLKESDAMAISERLSAEDYQPHLRTGEVRNPSGYWVYMPAMPAADARRIVAELDARGMTDYYIGSQNYISLGIFSGKGKARARLEQIEGLGYDAILDQRYRTRTVYWVDIERGDVPLLGSALWSEIQSQHTDIRVQRVSCE